MSVQKNVEILCKLIQASEVIMLYRNLLQITNENLKEFVRVSKKNNTDTLFVPVLFFAAKLQIFPIHLIHQINCDRFQQQFCKFHACYPPDGQNLHQSSCYGDFTKLVLNMKNRIPAQVPKNQYPTARFLIDQTGCCPTPRQCHRSLMPLCSNPLRLWLLHW